MNTLTATAGYVVYYPEDPIFCFNRVNVRVNHSGVGSNYYPDVYKYTIAVSYGDTTYYDTRYADSDTKLLWWNIAKYIQCLFDKDDIIGGEVKEDISVTIVKYAGDSVSLETLLTSSTYAAYRVTFTFYAFYAGLSAGEKLFKDRTIRYYPSFGNPLEVWGKSKGLYTYSTDYARNIVSVTYSGDTAKTYSIGTLVTSIMGTVNEKRSTINLKDVRGFDVDYRNTSDGEVLYTVKVITDNCTDGVYLKWLDNTALWNYYLFTPGATKITTKEVGDEYDGRYGEEDFDFETAVNGANITQGKTTTKTQTLCAPNVSLNERQTLETILRSPLVFWCPDPTDDPDTWIPVRAAAGNVSDDQNEMDDFTFDLTYPNQTAQTL